MLTCYSHSCRLPRGDLTYLAFRVAALDTLDNIEISGELGESPDEVGGFLGQVPILQQVLPPVQIDLLGETWSRQRTAELIEATLLDAAIVYAACQTAASVIEDDLKLAKLYLDGGPRQVRASITPNTPDRLDALFDRFWDDIDFLTLSDWQDMDAAQAAFLKRIMRFPDDQPIYEALSRGRLSPDLPSNLVGLLTRKEIEECVAVLSALGSTPT